MNPSDNHRIDSGPSFSVVLLAPRKLGLLARVLHRIASQTIAPQIEVVLVSPGAPSDTVPAGMTERIHSVCVVTVAENLTMPQARAAGILAATAPVVAFCEDHAYWSLDWAERMLARHREPWAGVGPALANANPQLAVSWASLYLGYGRWCAPMDAGEIDDLPGHNSSYKRSILVALGDQLEPLLQAESFLHAHLRATGHRLFLEASAVTSHINITAPRYFIKDWMMVGRLYAAAEAQKMSPGRRFWRGLISLPAVPRRVLWPIREALRPGRLPRHSIWSLLPYLFWGTLIRGVSETQGFWFGQGDATDIRWDLEFSKERFLHTDEERQSMEQF